MQAFGSMTGMDIFKQSIVPYVPKLVLRLLAAASPNPRLEQLRNASVVATKVAKQLIDEKAEALMGGKGNRDLMSLLGSCRALITTLADIISQFMQTHRRMSALACQMKK